MPETIPDVARLELEYIIGFNGAVSGGLKVVNKEHLIYPLGCTIIIEDVVSHKQEFLNGHSDEVTCVAVSNGGKYIASGQKTHMGYKAETIIWDYKERRLYASLVLHKVNVQALAFSKNDKYLATLGGPDDGSVVVWNIETKSAICGSQAQVKSAGDTHCICFSNVSDNRFVTGGNGTLRVWDLDVENRKIKSTDVILGQLKRIIRCIEMADDYAEPFFLCGTTSGDIIGVNMNTVRIQFLGPDKEKFSSGIISLCLLKTSDMLIGTGDGTLCLGVFNKIKDQKPNKLKVEFQKKKIWKNPKEISKAIAITSIAKRGAGHQIYIGTSNSEMFRFNLDDFVGELIKTCHSCCVNDIVFPHNRSNLFITCQDSEIRIWNLDQRQELIRKVVDNKKCNAIDITQDGSTLVSAWDDGKIRAFGFKNGCTGLFDKFEISDAHKNGVTAIKTTPDGNNIISGGGEGQVRIFEINKTPDPRKNGYRYRTSLKGVMKEHNGSVSDIKVRKNAKDCVSASADGTCIIWDIGEFTRSQIVFANTYFKCIAYGRDDCQIVTSGTDRKITYWEAGDGSQVRELDGSASGSVNALDTSTDCRFYVSGGDDKLIKLWTYEDGEVTHVGIGHSGSIKKAKICPNDEKIVSVSDDGAILIWKIPRECREHN